jgi:hypothetical protein
MKFSSYIWTKRAIHVESGIQIGVRIVCGRGHSAQVVHFQGLNGRINGSSYRT